MSTEVHVAKEWWAVARAEWGKTWSVWVPALWLLSTVLIAVITSTTLANDFVHSVSVGDFPRTATMPVIDAFGPSVSFAQIAVAAFAIHLVTPEYASASIGPTFMAQPRRWVVVTAKAMVGGGIGCILGAVAGPGVVWATSWVLGSAGANPISSTGAALGMGFVFAFACVVGVALAFALRSAVGALTAAFVLLVTTLAAPSSVGRWLPGPGGAAMVEDLAAGRFPWEGLSVVGSWMLVLTLVAGWLVNRRDA